MIFESTYADKDRVSNISASDSTLFQLIHKPEPEPYSRTPARANSKTAQTARKQSGICRRTSAAFYVLAGRWIIT